MNAAFWVLANRFVSDKIDTIAEVREKESIMDDRNPDNSRWTLEQFAQVGWLVIWLVSFVLAWVIYYTPVTSNWPKDCSTKSLTDIISILLTPGSWFGLAVIALTVVGASYFSRTIAGSYPKLARYVKHAGVVLVLILLAILALGCR